ncbi:FK506-binding protein 2B [Dispira simplex]|nr:FK506-binding protein 2B [Dispira simplex]
MSVSPPWTAEELKTDKVSKKALITFIQEHGNNEFLTQQKFGGKLQNIVKNSKREDVEAAYNVLFESKMFRQPGDTPLAELQAINRAQSQVKPKAASQEAQPTTAAEPGPVKYKKDILAKGDKKRFPRKGDTVTCFYTGQLEDGKVFDSNMPKGRKKGNPLRFKVGAGRVIRGWDEALLTMSIGEKAKLTIEPEWAYGKKGMADAGIPPNATLIFEVELVTIE